jgi:hypothetical protein
MQLNATDVLHAFRKDEPNSILTSLKQLRRWINLFLATEEPISAEGGGKE